MQDGRFADQRIRPVMVHNRTRSRKAEEPIGTPKHPSAFNIEYFASVATVAQARELCVNRTFSRGSAHKSTEAADADVLGSV
jgi:hypothetical protein